MNAAYYLLGAAIAGCFSCLVGLTFVSIAAAFGFTSLDWAFFVGVVATWAVILRIWWRW